MTVGFVRLNAVDLTNLAIEAPDTPMHVGMVAVLDGASICAADGQLRLAEIRADLDQLLSRVPELRRIVYHPGWLAGPPLWIDDPSFDIDRHVNGIALSPPGDEAALWHFATQKACAGPGDLLDRADVPEISGTDGSVSEPPSVREQPTSGPKPWRAADDRSNVRVLWPCPTHRLAGHG